MIFVCFFKLSTKSTINVNFSSQRNFWKKWTFGTVCYRKGTLRHAEHLSSIVQVRKVTSATNECNIKNLFGLPSMLHFLALFSLKIAAAVLQFAGNCGFGHTRAETEEFCVSTLKLQWRSPSSMLQAPALAKVALPQRKFTAAVVKLVVVAWNINGISRRQRKKPEESPSVLPASGPKTLGSLPSLNRQVVKHLAVILCHTS